MLTHLFRTGNFFVILNPYKMQNQKKTVVIINDFPKIIYEINSLLQEPNTDFVIDACDYPRPLALLSVAFPDMLILNLDLSKKSSAEYASAEIEANAEINRGMIIANTHIYYMSLCSTFQAEYCVSNTMDLEMLPGLIERQQLN